MLRRLNLGKAKIRPDENHRSFHNGDLELQANFDSGDSGGAAPLQHLVNGECSKPNNRLTVKLRRNETRKEKETGY